MMGDGEGQGGGVVEGRGGGSHPTTHTPLLPSPLPLDPTTLDGLLFIQKKYLVIELVQK